MTHISFKLATQAMAALVVPVSPLVASLLTESSDSDFSKAAAAVAKPNNWVAHCDGSSSNSSSAGWKQRQIKDAVLDWKVKEDALRAQWEKDEDGFMALPARAWPPQQPDADEQSQLETKFLACEAETKGVEGCGDIQFNLATCLVFNNLDPERGLKLYKDLSSTGHVDGTVAAGVVLLEGLGVPFDEDAGLKFLTTKRSLASPQGAYEYATAVYTGLVDNIDDPDKEAYKLFKQCADQEHTGGLFMAAEMVYQDEAPGDIKEATRLFANAAERGHRMARQRMREFFKL